MIGDYLKSVVASHWDRLPRHLILFVTSRCNLKCEQCFYWEDMDLNKGLHDITLEEVRALAGSRTLEKLLWLQIAGGEPFLRKDLPELIEAFAGLRELRHLTIPTNGFYTEGVLEKTERLARAVPRALVNVDVSIDGLEATHDRIRGAKGSFARLRATLAGLRALKARVANLGVGVILTQMSQNQAELEGALEHVITRLKPDHVALNMVRGNPREKVSGEGIDMELYARLCRRIEQAHLSGELSDFATGVGALNVAKDSLLHDLVGRTRAEGYQMPCKAGELSLVVKDAGDVYPCEILDRKIGNIRESGLDEIWAAEARRSARAFIRDTPCFCTHECFFSANIAFSPAVYPKLAAKAAALEAKRALRR